MSKAADLIAVIENEIDLGIDEIEAINSTIKTHYKQRKLVLKALKNHNNEIFHSARNLFLNNHELFSVL